MGSNPKRVSFSISRRDDSNGDILDQISVKGRLENLTDTVTP